LLIVRKKDQRVWRKVMYRHLRAFFLGAIAPCGLYVMFNIASGLWGLGWIHIFAWPITVAAGFMLVIYTGSLCSDTTCPWAPYLVALGFICSTTAIYVMLRGLPFHAMAAIAVVFSGWALWALVFYVRNYWNNAIKCLKLD